SRGTATLLAARRPLLLSPMHVGRDERLLPPRPHSTSLVTPNIERRDPWTPRPPGTSCCAPLAPATGTRSKNAPPSSSSGWTAAASLRRFSDKTSAPIGTAPW